MQIKNPAVGNRYLYLYQLGVLLSLDYGFESYFCVCAEQVIIRERHVQPRVPVACNNPLGHASPSGTGMYGPAETLYEDVIT